MPDTPSDQLNLPTLRQKISGRILTAGEDDYDRARTVWNGTIDRHPAAIVRCQQTEDVRKAVKVAREHDLPLSVKCGGHMTTGHAICDGLVLDLSLMNDVQIDENTRTARVQGGATWDQVDREALKFDLLPPGIPHPVGVGGFTLGGGMGVVGRKHGLAVDALREAEVVTANGHIVTASEEENSDLFWALRGGGGNFGIVTSFTFDLFDEPRACLTGNLLYSFDDAADVFEYFRSTVPETPDALYPIASIITVPEIPGIPEKHVGKPAVNFYVMSVGDPEKLREPMEEFCSFGEPFLRLIDAVDYTDLFVPFEVPKGERHHWASVYLNDLPDNLIDLLATKSTPLPTPTTGISVYACGGAMGRVSSDATAFAHREASYLAHITTQWSSPAEDDAHQEWTRRLHQKIAKFGTGGEYINNQTDDDAERVRAAFGDNYDRLSQVKATWDPDNFFRMNQNISPAG